jgi:hypothetical protein
MDALRQRLGEAGKSRLSGSKARKQRKAASCQRELLMKWRVTDDQPSRRGSANDWAGVIAQPTFPISIRTSRRRR